MKRSTEAFARIIVLSVLVGLILGIVVLRWLGGRGVIEVHARLPEQGGWSPPDLTAQVGVPLKLRLVSEDVVHGFAVGQMDWSAVDIKPGKATNIELTFDKPGKYVFYCTRWCGINHWRMRGTIQVTGVEEASTAQALPLYLQLKLSLDADHRTTVLPQQRPSALRGTALKVTLPPSYLDLNYYRTHSPTQVWLELRQEASIKALNDQQVWDLVASIWKSHATQPSLEQGQSLYSANCAACHGEKGAGDGVMADQLAKPQSTQAGNQPRGMGEMATAPTKFTDPALMLGDSPAVLQGKIIRGGMGTGMPYWGPIFTEPQTWDLVNYLWTFQFDS